MVIFMSEIRHVPYGKVPPDGLTGYYIAKQEGSSPDTLKVCPRCGVIVYDEEAHERFHDAIEVQPR